MTPTETPVVTDIIQTATRFINTTASHIFLTGKAGTGKTTFLRSLAQRTHKQFAIVAPTGIAALNAGGVTIHSQFLLPLGMFLPDRHLEGDVSTGGSFYTSNTLARKHPLNSARKQVLRTIDLLVIDEVSMLRADLLDAIDYRLKSVRGNFYQSFGGVQLLLIGDLFQLPPVVKREEESQLKRYYKSAWFFESLALKKDGFVYIELDKIFRQQDETFIRLLNNLRNNKATREDIDALNKHYQSPEEIQQLREVITLTTHNYKADELNSNALRSIDAPSKMFHATIEGDFPESMHPVLEHLELKEGAQIMFTKNDSEDKMYFNGKLAIVKSIVRDEVKVIMAGTHEEYTLKKETWENKRYRIDANSQEMEEEVIGTFKQYPVKLAWSITVHKSQGLTFDKAIIDVGKAFADGQVYVALSRLRSLDGLIMRTRIDPDVISTDKQISSFSEANNRPETLLEIIQDKQRSYIKHLIQKTFNFEGLVKECAYIQRSHKDLTTLEDPSMKPVLTRVSEALLGEKGNTEKFNQQLLHLLEGGDQARFIERIKKGSDYYSNFILTLAKTLLLHLEEMKHRKRVKGYVNSLGDLDQLMFKKLEEVDKATYLIEAILEQRDEFDYKALSAQRTEVRRKILIDVHNKVGIPPDTKKKTRKSGKQAAKSEPSTYDITLSMFRSGMTVEAIAKERSLVPGTIEGHLAKAVERKSIDILELVDEESLNEIHEALKTMPEGFSSKELFTKLAGRYSYGKLRAVMLHTGIVSYNKKE